METSIDPGLQEDESTKVPDKAQPPEVRLRGRVGKISGLYGKSMWDGSYPEKISALLEISSPRKPKEVMSLVDRVATLSRFVSRAIDHCAPFFNVLRGSKEV